MKSTLKTFAAIAAVLGIAAIAANGHAVEPQTFGHLDIGGAVAKLPRTSKHVLEEQRLIDNGLTGVRVFRVYKPVPRHHHKYADTYLYILSGRAEVSINGRKPIVAGAGSLVFWQNGVDHEVTQILDEPLVFLAFDSPVRREGDVTFFKPSKPTEDLKKW